MKLRAEALRPRATVGTLTAPTKPKPSKRTPRLKRDPKGCFPCVGTGIECGRYRERSWSGRYICGGAVGVLCRACQLTGTTPMKRSLRHPVKRD